MPNEQRPLKVFLCHARADKQKVRELYRSLRKRGIQPWLDAEDLVAGQDWRVEIPKAIRASDAIIICLSKNSINKEGFVQTEIAFALEKALEIPPGRIFIIPARLEDCEVPDRLERFQWVDLFEEGGFRRLMKALRTRAGQLERATVQVPEIYEPSPDLAPIPEIEENGKTAAKAEREKVEKVRKDEAERKISEKAEREKAKPEAVEQGKREKAERRATQIIGLNEVLSNFLASFKLAITKAKSLIRIGGILGIFLALFWIGSWAMPQFSSFLPIANSSITASPTGIIALLSSPVAFTKTVMPSATPTRQITSSPTVLPSEITDAKGVQMMLVPAGEFTMGSDSHILLDWGPAHKVYLESYYIDKYEVTLASYSSCVNEGVCDPPHSPMGSHTRSSYYGNAEFDNYPVINVDWFQAKLYCEWRETYLPTEAQWEKAARGKDGRTYPWGEGINCSKANYGDCTSDTTEVGSYESGQSQYGVYDMAGNVMEWTMSLFRDYPYISNDGREDLSSLQSRILRGGAWTSDPDRLRSYSRYATRTKYAFESAGFRCAKPVKP